MKRTKRILLGLACVVLLAVSWMTAVTAKSEADRQRELIDQAAAYTRDEVYILAVPLLEEAAGYRDEFTLEAEAALKQVYLRLEDKDDFQYRYTNLLDKQMAREDASPDIFLEAAQYYIDRQDLSQSLAVLKKGIKQTGDERLVHFYENNRYGFQISREFYEEAGPICNGYSKVSRLGQWGLAYGGGGIAIPCAYDKISTFSGDRAIVRKDGVISAIDSSQNRLALLHEAAEDFGDYSEDRLSLKLPGGWKLATGTFQTGSMELEELGMFSNGYAPARLGGKWGVISADGSEWLLAPQYDGVCQDELKRCYHQERVFVRQDGRVYLLNPEGEQISGPYEDARPFDSGWAAVKQDGKWGFVDTEGVVQIEFQYDDALSFGQHLAAVEEDGLWGYISLRGEMVIEPQFLEAKSFSEGSAPVRTDFGWQFISLLEYEGGGGLF